MSEQIFDQLSAFMDDELSSEESAFLVRRLERDPEARARFIRYSMIGSALRTELLQPDPRLLSRRVQDALVGAPTQARPATAIPASAASQPRWLNPAFGVGIAATVAIAALFTVRVVNDVDDGVGAEVLAADTVVAPSYVVPQPEPPERMIVTAPPVRLTNYLMYHGEYASHLSRTSVHSNVVGGNTATAAESAPR